MDHSAAVHRRASGDAGARQRLHRNLQMVFQNPYSSLNPRMTVAQTVGEALAFHRIVPAAEIAGETARLLSLVGLSPDLGSRYPRALSGGQCQRVGLARAMSVRPEMLVLDEAVAALDVSIQAQVLNLLIDLREAHGLSMIFIAHELSVVRHISHRVAVMYLGKIVEIGRRDEIFEAPKHPYTAALLSAVPEPDPRTRSKLAIESVNPKPSAASPAAAMVPHSSSPPMGPCRLAARCSAGKCPLTVRP